MVVVFNEFFELTKRRELKWMDKPRKCS